MPENLSNLPWYSVIFAILLALLALYRNLETAEKLWLRIKNISRRSEKIILQYTGVKCILEQGNLPYPVSAYPSIDIENPHDFALRLLVLSARTEFGSRIAEISMSSIREIVAAPHTLDICVDGPPVKIDPPVKGIISGRIDIKIAFVREGEDVNSRNADVLHIVGKIALHKFAHGWQSRFLPDLGSPVPAMRLERLQKVDEHGDMWMGN